MYPCFVISLPDEQKRRAFMADHLQERGIEFEWFNAVDGRKMDVLAHPAYDKARRRACHGRDLKPGELGCLLSHQAVYQKIIDDNLDYAFILEDDVQLHPKAKAVLESLQASNFDFDVVRLFGSEKVARAKHRKIIELKDGFYLVRLQSTPGGTQGQIISRSGAQKLLKALQILTFPIDTVHGRCWETGINSYSIQPGIALHDESFDSAIGDARFDKTIKLEGGERFRYKINRPLFKLGEAVGKRWIYYKNYPHDVAVQRKKYS